jgi:hypothetical protein
MTITESIARARSTDPQTSHDAAASVTHVSETQAAILVLLRSTPMCDERLVEQYRTWEPLENLPKATDQSIRSRRAELVRMGLVVAADYRERMSTGRMGQVWQVVR